MYTLKGSIFHLEWENTGGRGGCGHGNRWWQIPAAFSGFWPKLPRIQVMVHNSLCIVPWKTWRSWATAVDCSLHEARSRFLNMRKKGSALLNSFSLARKQYQTMHKGSWATLHHPWNIPGAAVDVETILVLPVYFRPNELNVEARSESISEVSKDSHCNHYCHISFFFFNTVHRFGFYGIPFPSKKKCWFRK